LYSRLKHRPAPVHPDAAILGVPSFYGCARLRQSGAKNPAPRRFSGMNRRALVIVGPHACRQSNSMGPRQNARLYWTGGEGLAPSLAAAW
jgi:hypothetical protein